MPNAIVLVQLGQKQDLKHYAEIIMIGLSDYPKSACGNTNLMTTLNFQCSSLLLSKLIRVQSKLDPSLEL